MALQVKGKQEKINREIEAVSEKMKRTKMKASDLIIPFSIGIVLVLLTLFVFVPMISAAIDYQKEMGEVKGKINTLKTLEKAVNNIDQAAITDDVITSKKVIPKVLKVSDFLYYVDTLAMDKGLKQRELSAGDTVSKGSGNNVGSSSVSGPVEYSGTYEKILSFLDEVQTASPYLVKIKNVEMAKSGGSGEWSLSLTVDGYYMAEKSNQEINLYTPFKLYSSYESTMIILKEKASKIE